MLAALPACSTPADDRAIVSDVLSAIAAGSTAGVAADFTPEGQRQLGDRLRFTLAHDDLAKLGALQGVQPDPNASPRGEGTFRRESFVATFAGGTRRVDATFDPAGKIAAFWVR